MFEPNVGNTIFDGWNDKDGLMLCGYEWGFSKTDQDEFGVEGAPRASVPHAFSNKSLEYGEVAKRWPYDRNIIKWFEFFGHKLDQSETGGDFEKCIIQTNWCDTLNNKIEGDYWAKLLHPLQVTNFINHIDHFKPRLLFFFGSQIIKIMQCSEVLPQFTAITGEITQPLSFIKKPFSGRSFNVGFQSFEKCNVVCFPHPSSSHGLSDQYIQLFATEISSLITEFKKFRGLPCT